MAAPLSDGAAKATDADAIPGVTVGASVTRPGAPTGTTADEASESVPAPAPLMAVTTIR